MTRLMGRRACRPHWYLTWLRVSCVPVHVLGSAALLLDGSPIQKSSSALMQAAGCCTGRVVQTPHIDVPLGGMIGPIARIDFNPIGMVIGGREGVWMGSLRGVCETICFV